MRKIKPLLILVILLGATCARAQEIRLGMTKSEIENVIARHPEWIVKPKAPEYLSKVDSDSIVRVHYPGSFEVEGYEMNDLTGRLTYKLSASDSVVEVSWKSEYLTFGDDRNTASRTYWEMLSSYAEKFGIASGTQDQRTLNDISTWEVDGGTLYLTYDPRFPHIFVTWISITR